jgi:ferric-dicitrate binding protein FerR (iron transport regulator)
LLALHLLGALISAHNGILVNDRRQTMANASTTTTDAPRTATRRGLLWGAGLAGAGAAAVAVTGRAPTPEVAQEAKFPTPEKGGGYHVTDHIKHYYATTLV